MVPISWTLPGDKSSWMLFEDSFINCYFPVPQDGGGLPVASLVYFLVQLFIERKEISPEESATIKLNRIDVNWFTIKSRSYDLFTLKGAIV